MFVFLLRQNLGWWVKLTLSQCFSCKWNDRWESWFHIYLWFKQYYMKNDNYSKYALLLSKQMAQLRCAGDKFWYKCFIFCIHQEAYTIIIRNFSSQKEGIGLKVHFCTYINLIIHAFLYYRPPFYFFCGSLNSAVLKNDWDSINE